MYLPSGPCGLSGPAGRKRGAAQSCDTCAGTIAGCGLTRVHCLYPAINLSPATSVITGSTEGSFEGERKVMAALTRSTRPIATSRINFLLIVVLQSYITSFSGKRD